MILGNKREVVKNKPVVKLHNRFDISVVDSNGEIRKKAFAENVICDGLWTTLYASTRFYFYKIGIGTGSGTPSSSDSALFARLGLPIAATRVYVQNDPFANHYLVTQEITIKPEEWVGESITEVGVFGTNDVLSTHAMIKDMNGVPISILKTDTDLIKIRATIYLELPDFRTLKLWPMYDMVPQGEMSTNSLFDCLCGVTALTSLMYMKYDELPNDDIAGPRFIYNAPEKSITVPFNRIDADRTVLNSTDMTFVEMRGYFNAKTSTPFYFGKVGDPWLPGTMITGETIGTGDGINTDFSQRHIFSGNEKVYINGVLSTIPYTMGQPRTDKSNLFMGIRKYVIPGSTIDNLRYYRTPSAGNMITLTMGDIMESPAPERGVRRLSMGYADKTSVMFGSDNLVDWVQMSAQWDGGNITINKEHQRFKYWKLSNDPKTTDKEFGIYYAYLSNEYSTGITFETPPPIGSLITADYFTKSIPKTVNNVFDFSFTMVLNEG